MTTTSPDLRRGRLSESEAARERMLAVRGEPLFVADWDRVLMIHYEVEPAALQQVVPFQVDLFEGRAFVSLVAFTLSGMRPRFGGRLSGWMLKPIATHNFLNVRTYVRHGEERGIYFLAEWLSNRLSVLLGPRVFGLPYRLGKLDYSHAWKSGMLTGRVVDTNRNGRLSYRALLDGNSRFDVCEPNWLCEWLMERYTAFTRISGRGRFFRVWHPNWRQTPVQIEVFEQTLLMRNWSLFNNSRIVGANFSPGLAEVWMGRPHGLREEEQE